MADTTRTHGPTAPLVAALICSLVLLAASADAAGRPPAAGPSSGRAGMVLDADPPTATAEGTLPAERRPSPARSTEGLQRVTFADGSQRVDLQGRFRAYSVLTIAADGTLQLACADDPEVAIALARAAARPGRGAHRARPVFGPREE